MANVTVTQLEMFCAATGKALVTGAAAIAALTWTPSGRGEAILWAVMVIALVAGVAALTALPRFIASHRAPIARCVAEIRAERRKAVRCNTIRHQEDTQ